MPGLMLTDEHWSRKGVLIRLFKTLSQNSDCEWEFIDGSYIKAHQHSAGAASKCNQGIGLSRGGNTSKVHLAVDSYGLPIEFLVTSGDVHDSQAANELIDKLHAGCHKRQQSFNSVLPQALYGVFTHSHFINLDLLYFFSCEQWDWFFISLSLIYSPLRA